MKGIRPNQWINTLILRADKNVSKLKCKIALILKYAVLVISLELHDLDINLNVSHWKNELLEQTKRKHHHHHRVVIGTSSGTQKCSAVISYNNFGINASLNLFWIMNKILWSLAWLAGNSIERHRGCRNILSQKLLFFMELLISSNPAVVWPGSPAQ